MYSIYAVYRLIIRLIYTYVQYGGSFIFKLLIEIQSQKRRGGLDKIKKSRDKCTTRSYWIAPFICVFSRNSV